MQPVWPPTEVPDEEYKRPKEALARGEADQIEVTFRRSPLAAAIGGTLRTAIKNQAGKPGWMSRRSSRLR
jgi:hypothetical protein